MISREVRLLFRVWFWICYAASVGWILYFRLYLLPLHGQGHGWPFPTFQPSTLDPDEPILLLTNFIVDVIFWLGVASLPPIIMFAWSTVKTREGGKQ